MQQLTLTAQAVTHQTYAALLAIAGRARSTGDVADAGEQARDRGAVSLEQVLWFVAAGISVTVIAGILWATIRNEAEDQSNIQRPAAP